MAAKKMALVAPDLLERLKPPKNPLEAELDKIMRSSTPDAVKLKLYQHALHSLGGSQPSKPKTTEVILKDQPPSDSQIIKGLPKKSREAARSILQYLMDSGRVSVGTNSELHVDNKRWLGSDISELLQYVTGTSNAIAPTASLEFLKLLNELSVPVSVILNKKALPVIATPPPPVIEAVQPVGPTPVLTKIRKPKAKTGITPAGPSNSARKSTPRRRIAPYFPFEQEASGLKGKWKSLKH